MAKTQSLAGATDGLPKNGTELVCEPFGECQPCPEDDMQEPFCQPFGNRRLLHCVPPPPAPGTPSTPPGAEIPAWESCGRIPTVERYDFFEFVACNVALAAVALGVLFVRSKRVQALQAGRLAARIGFGRT